MIKPSQYYSPISDSDLLKPLAILVLDLQQYINTLESNDLLSMVVQTEIGYYLPGKNKPYIEEDIYYPVEFYQSKDPRHAITNLEDVLNTRIPLIPLNNPKKIINPKLISKYRKEITTKPKINIKALGLVTAYAVRFLNYITPANTWHTGVFPKPSYYISEDYDTREVDDAIETALDSLYIQIREFAGSDIWNLYNITRKGTSLYIEKMIDYRIYDWYRINRELSGEED